MTALPTRQCELLVVGAGMAALAAALFAARSGISTIQVGRVGQINFASGLMDLMGVHPVAAARVRIDPWAAIRETVGENPRHPYARLNPREIQTAFDTVTGFLGEARLPYTGLADRNSLVLTAAGTVKPTYRMPAAIGPNAEALAQGSPCRIVGFQGLKGFSARQIVETRAADWPNLRATTLAFPPGRGDRYPEPMARYLDTPAGRERLVERLAPHLEDETHLGFPALLGLEHSEAVRAHLSTRLGRTVFEIPTMPPAVPGLRLRRAFERRLPVLGVQALHQKEVLRVETGADGFRFEIGRREPELRVEARGAMLATGRFFGRGLTAERTGIREPLFDLPVAQPATRGDWHRTDFLDRRGHEINRAGLETDADFRPLNRDGAPFHPRLFAVGSILAHQDWMRMKCGAGLAIATAWRAVEGWVRAESPSSTTG